MSLQRIHQDGVIYYQNSAWTTLKHGIFTRHGGVSDSYWASLNVGGTNGDDVDAVRSNHDIMYSTLGVHQERACTTWLVHGVDTIVAFGPVKGRRWLAKADGIVTDKADTPLVMRYADCTPLLFHDPKKGVIGLAHAGWRGTVKGMGNSVVQTMTHYYACRAQDIEVVIGPSISQKNYQVGEEVVAAVQDYYGDVEGLICRDPADGTAYFDMWHANQLDLERCGVENVRIMGICTYDNKADFFSHRAEQGKTGRFGVVMSL